MVVWLKLLCWAASLLVGIAIPFCLGILLGQDWLISIPVVVLFALIFQGIVGRILFKDNLRFW